MLKIMDYWLWLWGYSKENCYPTCFLLHKTDSWKLDRFLLPIAWQNVWIPPKGTVNDWLCSLYTSNISQGGRPDHSSFSLKLHRVQYIIMMDFFDMNCYQDKHCGLIYMCGKSTNNARMKCTKGYKKSINLESWMINLWSGFLYN